MILCPLCKGVNFFSSAETLLYNLISSATQCIACPLCSDVLRGFDKFTLHLCSHILKCDSNVINLKMNDANIMNINERFENNIHLDKPVSLVPKSLDNFHERQKNRFHLLPSSHEFTSSSEKFDNVGDNFSRNSTIHSSHELLNLVGGDKEPNTEIDDDSYSASGMSKICDAHCHNNLNRIICVDEAENTNINLTRNIHLKTNKADNFKIYKFTAKELATRSNFDENCVPSIETFEKKKDFVAGKLMSVKKSDKCDLFLEANASDNRDHFIIEEPDTRMRSITYQESGVQSTLIENYIQHSTEHDFILEDSENRNLHCTYSKKVNKDFTAAKSVVNTDMTTTTCSSLNIGSNPENCISNPILGKPNLNLNSDLYVLPTNKVCAKDINQVKANHTKRDTLEDNLPKEIPAVGVNEYGSLLSLAYQGVNCTICSVSLPNDNLMALHNELVHVGSDPAQRKAKTKASTLNRYKVSHFTGKLGQTSTNEQKEDDNIQYLCNICFKFFKKEYYLNQHLKTHDDKQWACDDCRKLFATKYSLQKHKRLHTGEMPYACPVCNKQYTFQQSYQKHLSYHSNEKRYTCKECCRSFKELSTLYNHQRIHTGEKPYSCDICGKKFRQRVACLVHKRIHTGTKPYECAKCHKSFRYKVSLKEHKCMPQTEILIEKFECLKE